LLPAPVEDEPPADGLDELPLEGDVVELEPLGGGIGVELEERGVDAPWSLPLELLLDPELSQATSDSAERRAAAISHFLSIMRLHPASVVQKTYEAITGRRAQNSLLRISSHHEAFGARVSVSRHEGELIFPI
jgi:hypothetical protein